MSVMYGGVPGYPPYRVGTDGSVWSLFNQGRPSDNGKIGTKWRRLKGTRSGSPYQSVVLTDSDGVHKRMLVGALVLTVFAGPRPVGMEVCHGKGGSLDDSLKNVRWDTHLSNCDDRVLHGSQKYGEDHYACTIPVSELKEVRDLRSKGLNYTEISKLSGVSRSQAHRIVTGQTRKKGV